MRLIFTQQFHEHNYSIGILSIFFFRNKTGLKFSEK